MKPGKEGLDVEPGGKPPPVLEKLELSSELEDAESRTTSRGQKEPCQVRPSLLVWVPRGREEAQKMCVSVVVWAQRLGWR
eukprot:1161293-Pelagomonas_calceolata.AAC.4